VYLVVTTMTPSRVPVEPVVMPFGVLTHEAAREVQTRWASTGRGSFDTNTWAYLHVPAVDRPIFSTLFARGSIDADSGYECCSNLLHLVEYL